MILFSSLSRGDFHQGSDVDIAVIADWKERFLDRVGILMELNTFGLPLEPVGHTKGSFQDVVRRNDCLALQILEEGKGALPEF